MGQVLALVNMQAWPFSLLVSASIFTFGELQKNEHFNNWYSIKILRALLNILCERLSKGHISFWRALEKFGGSNSQKYMSCSCHEVETLLQYIHI